MCKSVSYPPPILHNTYVPRPAFLDCPPHLSRVVCYFHSLIEWHLKTPMIDGGGVLPTAAIFWTDGGGRILKSLKL